MTKEARLAFLKFARSSEAKWKANFRDLNAAVTRMSTLAPGGRIGLEILEAEQSRLRSTWRDAGAPGSDDALLSAALGEEKAGQLDLFDRAQLACVIRVCQNSGSLSEAGRQLFSISRTGKKIANDADRLRKYLARFDLTWPCRTERV
jgi:transcriptional regulatory protein RtcR